MIALLLVAAQLEVHVAITAEHASDDATTKAQVTVASKATRTHARLQLAPGQDGFSMLANTNLALAPEAAACFDGPNLVSKIETFAGDGFSNSRRRMELFKRIEHPSLPAELFQISAD